MQTNDGKLIIFSGSSRCGKTAKAVRVVRELKSPCVFVWDIEAQWCKLQGYKRINTMAEFKRIVVTGKAGKYALVYSGADMKAAFEQFCACVFHYANWFGACSVVAEELADVTTTAKASPFWGMLVRRGLKRGMNIIAISQRWAEADKTAIGNASDFYLFRMATDTDIDYMARKTRVSKEALEVLKPLEYVHYNALTQQINKAKLKFD